MAERDRPGVLVRRILEDEHRPHRPPPLPFDYHSELVGGRSPCPERRPNLLPAEQSYGWRYDASSPAGTPAWPAQTDGIWEFPALPVESAALGFDRVYRGSRAPLLIDTGGRLGATESLMAGICHRDGVRCVSFRQLADWLDAQDPATVSRLRDAG